MSAKIKVNLGAADKGGLYFIQCKSHYAYDYILWWRPERRGYTHDLSQAGLYTEEQAVSICKTRGEEVAWPAELVRQRTDAAVSIERLRGDDIKPFIEPKPKPFKKPEKPDPGHCSKCGRFFSLENCPPDADVCDVCDPPLPFSSRRA